MEFILANFQLLGGGLVLIAVIIYAVFARQWNILKIAAYQLMVVAQKLMATSAGSARMEDVFQKVWKLVPPWLKKFTTEAMIREKLQAWYDIIENLLKAETETGNNTEEIIE